MTAAGDAPRFGRRGRPPARGRCARSPEAKKARYLQRGDRYFQKEQYREAILEYRNALRLDEKNPRAVRQLGLAHFQLAEIGQALRYLLKAQEQSPDDLDVRLKIGLIFHGIGKMDEARQEASSSWPRTRGT